MAGYFKKVKTPWTSQPQSPVGIVRSLIPFRLSTLIIGSELFNRATSTPVTLGSGVSRIYTSAGSVLTTSSRGAVDNYIHLDRSPPSGGLTVIAIARRHSSYGSGAIDFLWNTNNSSYTIGANINLSNAWAGAGNENKLGGFGSLYLDGVKQAGTSSDSALVNNQYYNIVCRTSSYTAGAEATYLGANTNALFSTDIDCALLCVIEGDIGDSLAREISRNPWRLFTPQERRVFVNVATSGVTGTLNSTLDSFTSNLSGTTTIVGSINNTFSSFTSSITGSSTIVGQIAYTNQNVTSNITGTTAVVGQIAVTNQNNTSNITGNVGSGVTGIIDSALQNSTSSIQGTTQITGTMSVIMESFTSVIQGTTTILGTISKTMDDFISSISGFIGEAKARLLSLLGVGS